MSRAKRIGVKRFRKLLQFEHLEARALLASDLSNPILVDGREAVRDELLVQYAPQTPITQRSSAALGASVTVAETIHTRTMQLAGTGVLERIVINPGVDMQTAMNALKQNPNVLYVEPNFIFRTAAVSNDTLYANGSLWGMYSNDSPTAIGPAGTTNTFGSQAEKAWNNNILGNSNTYIGVIDEGIQFSHPDLIDNMWLNPFEIAGDGIDNDGNGFVDDMRGWDFVNNDNSVYDGVGDDHGTHCAGTIGGVGGNGTGVAGVAWDVTMISVKFLGPSGGTLADAVKSVDYVTDLKNRHGLNIVATSNSWGGGGYAQSLHDAIIRGAKRNILFVAAAGNSTNNNDATPFYPANYDTSVGTTTESAAGYDAVISVAAITNTGAIASFSSFGATTVDLGAPGAGIASTYPSNTYASASGTSMATPHVSGAIALYASTQAVGTPAASIRQAILQNATPTPSLAGKTVTGGRLNAFFAFTAPTVSSSAATNVTDKTARLNGNASSDGGAWITERGFVYSLTSANNNPRINGTGTTKVTVSGTTGVFTRDLIELAASSNYSFVAYATNAVGTSYSTTQSFTTLATPVLPTIGNPTVSGLTMTTATLGGNVIADGNLPITARGVVYALTSVNPDPTLGGNGTTTVTDSQTTTGVFTLPVTGLSSGSDYSFVAYVTNGLGTSYTAPVSTFRTLTLPTLGGLAVPHVFDSMSAANSSVDADGGAPITARGFVISPTSLNNSPQLGGTGVANIAAGTGSGAFSRGVGPLVPSTEYSIAAYATSAAGTAYSTVSTFTTSPAPATSLSAGDLAFTGYNGTTATERVSFVLLRSVSPGTSILFTDNAWDASLTPPAFATNEAQYQIGFVQAFGAGSRFYYDSSLNSFVNFDGTTTGLVSSVSGTTGLSNTGDQVTSVQGTLASPTSFLAQISSGAFITSGSPTTQTTYLAPGLGIGTSAIALNAAASNGVLNSADPDVGSSINNIASGIRSIVNDVSNWTVNTSTSLVVPPEIAFAVFQLPSITSQPSNSTITYGENTVFTASSSGVPAPTAQWQTLVGGAWINIDSATDSGVYSGFTTNTLTVTKPPVSLSARAYRALYTNAAGIATTNEATLTVNRRGLTITAQPKEKVGGRSDPALTFTTDGLVSGDLLIGALSRTAGDSAGVYAIQQGTLTNANNPNYNITYNGANLTITFTLGLNSGSSFSPWQRSMVTSLVVNFYEPVTLGSGAFTLQNLGIFTATTSTIPSNQLVISPSSGAHTSFTITFDAGSGANGTTLNGITKRVGGVSTGTNGNTLADGNYQLTINTANLTGGSALVGNNVIGDRSADNFFRLYGDSNGDGRVDGVDLTAIRAILLSGAAYNPAFDWDGNGSVSAGEDTTNFSQRQNRRRRTW